MQLLFPVPTGLLQIATPYLVQVALCRKFGWHTRNVASRPILCRICRSAFLKTTYTINCRTNSILLMHSSGEKLNIFLFVSSHEKSRDIVWNLMRSTLRIIIHSNWLHLMLDWVHASHYLVTYDERLNEPHPEIFFKGTRSKFSRSPSEPRALSCWAPWYLCLWPSTTMVRLLGRIEVPSLNTQIRQLHRYSQCVCLRWTVASWTLSLHSLTSNLTLGLMEALC